MTYSVSSLTVNLLTHSVSSYRSTKCYTERRKLEQQLSITAQTTKQVNSLINAAYIEPEVMHESEAKYSRNIVTIGDVAEGGQLPSQPA